MKRRVVITGYGVITPLGRNTQETFLNASQGRSGVDFIRAFDASGLPCQIAGQVDDRWIPEDEVNEGRRLRKFSSRGLRLAMAAATEAAARARIDQIPDRDKIGVALGSYGENSSVEDVTFLHRFYDGNGHWDLEGLMREGGYDYFNFYRRKPDIASCLIAKRFECKGMNLSLASACAAGAQAIGEAAKAIQAGMCNVMIAGGCEATLTLIGFIGFVLIKALAERYATPQSASRPFDRKRSGFVLSEGAGVVILEALDHALKRDAPVFGELLGYGASADAYRITDMHPQGEGAVLAMRSALADASLDPRNIDYVNAHGTSTKQNDLAETRALKTVFGDRAGEVPVSSNKSMLGHTIAAAGAIEFVLTLVGMNRSVILPTINYETPDPKCDLWYVPNKALEWEQEIALSNSFGFGGQNACLCLKRFNG